METVIEEDAMPNETKQMAEWKALIFNTPISNDTKIQFIKEALATGRYDIHNHHIAAKMLEHSLVTEPTECA